jgi:hypothetical protein
MPDRRLLKIIEGRRQGQTAGLIHSGKPHGITFLPNVHCLNLIEKKEKSNRQKSLQSSEVAPKTDVAGQPLLIKIACF